MLMLRGTVRGIADVERALRSIPAALQKSKLQEAMLQAAAPVAEQMRAGAPKRTGGMAETITAQPISGEKLGREVGNSANQVSIAIGPTSGKDGGKQLRGFVAIFHELGTSKMPARPFLRPAWESGRDGFQKDMRGSFGELVSDAARAAGMGVTR